MPRIKIQDKLKMMPTSRPISIATMTTVKNVTSHTIASNRDILQNWKNCFVCINMPFKATMTILAKTH